ncbi:MAG: hypothetical protein WC486_03690 [Candidatus Omnitrophota bacterium]
MAKKRVIMALSIVLIACLGLVLAVDCSFAQLAQKAAEEEIPPRKDYTGTLGFIPAFFDRGKVSSMLSISQGIDNNVYLDSRRKVSGFTQQLFKTSITSPITDNLDGILGYEVMNLTYENGPADVNMVANTLKAGTEYRFCKNIKLLTEGKFTANNYYTTGDDNSLDYSIENKIRQNLPQKMYHSFSYDFMFKDYTTDHVSNGIGVIMDRKRNDMRNTFEYEVGKYFAKDLVKVKIQYYTNDSNERFLDYYDYTSTKPSISLLHLFNDKTFSLLSYSMQYRNYDTRTILTDATVDEKDVTRVLTAALYRNITKDLTVGLSYTYRHNSSNEPSSKYSGSMFALNASYTF